MTSSGPFWGSMRRPPRGQFFLEIFAGEAVLTRAMRNAGFACLPPIELEKNQFVPFSTDITDDRVLLHVRMLLTEGYITYIHFGTPCSSFSLARKADGGPPPLRSPQALFGLPGLKPADQLKVDIGNQLMQLTADLIHQCQKHGAKWSVENPLGSYLWAMPPLQELAISGRRIELDMCRFGSPHMKPTALLTTAALDSLAQRCDMSVRPHNHDPLVGTEMVQGRRQFKTKRAQVYPSELCRQWAAALGSDSDPNAKMFTMTTPAADRKRPLGQPTPWSAHRQESSGHKAVGAGYQLKKSVLPPLPVAEFEPGEAVKIALNTIHPFSRAPALEPDLQEALALTALHPEWVVTHRCRALHYWEHRAVALLPHTDHELSAIPDPWLRRLLRGADDGKPVALGTCTHIALWRELAAAARSVDAKLVDQMLTGLPIVGSITPSNRWGPFDKEQTVLQLHELEKRAWDFSARVVANVRKCEVTENTQKVWDATMEDVAEGVTLGPFFSKEEVSKIVGTPWIPTQRFEVVQKNKVRGVDSATINGINVATKITEKLDLPSTDTNVAAIRWLRSQVGQRSLEGWVLDERKAYRQVPIDPAHRKWSVISLREPSSGRVSFFVMIGHSFGLVSAVYNYNRRSALITDILRRVFAVAAFNFYDDKYGFEPSETIDSAFTAAQAVHLWLGARFDQKKLQKTTAPTILGVTYDLSNMKLLIKESRKSELVDEIDGILSSRVLSPGQAGKLRGKLMFGSSQLWGKVGRAFLRALSERQYSRVPALSLNKPIRLALNEWRHLIQKGPARPIELITEKKADFVIFTDGSFPDEREDSLEYPWIGGVLLGIGRTPLQFGARVPERLIQKWLPRKSQIATVEMFAVVVALASFRDLILGSWILIFVDSEPVLGALVKGYSSKEDMCELTGVFWQLALEIRALAYLDRVSTDANPADPPSRNKMDIGTKLGWKTVRAVFPDL